MAYGNRMCFGGFCRPPLAPNTKSCPNEVIRRETFLEQDCNPGNLVLPVSKVNKNSSGMVTAFSVSSQGCGGHDAFISCDWIVSLRWRAVFQISSVLLIVLLVLQSQLSITCLAKSNLERLRGMTKTLLLPERSSNSRVSLNSPSSFLLKWVRVDSLISVTPWDFKKEVNRVYNHSNNPRVLEQTCLDVRKQILIGL